MITEALKLHKLGLNVCFTKDPSSKGGKAPIGYWRDFIDGQQTEKEIIGVRRRNLTSSSCQFPALSNARIIILYLPDFS